ncbi:PucR family transcriptional regulator [Streptomyces sp. NPDC056002]|uniref:PucR family transcriptional regulator n=1 Tax=Streptomyces sp. NPDC056002 TaxID=3345675 RepID=UPI0035E1D343
MLTLADVVAMPTLGQRVLAGAAGLDRVVLWAHSCEMPDPWSWIDRDELLMTVGLGLPRTPGEQTAFVRKLAAAGVAGMTVGDDGMAPPLTPELLQEAERLGFPILSTDHAVPFVVVARTVALANEGQTQQLQLISRVYRALNDVPANPARSLASMEKIFGVRLAVADTATGQLVFTGSLDPDPGERPGPRHWPLATTRPSELLVDEDSAHLLDSFTLAHLQQVVTTAVNTVLTTAALTAARGEHLLSGALAGHLPSRALDQQAEALGLCGDTIQVVAASTARPYDDLLSVLALAPLPHLPLRTPDHLVCCIRSGDRATALGLLEPLSDRIGLSPVFDDLTGAATAVRRAVWTLACARDGDVLAYEDVRGSVLPSDATTATELAQAVLGPLLDDTDRGRRLLRTLDAFLAHDRSWAATAEHLNIHRQSLGYRLQQIEVATGRNLKKSQDLAELWVAVTAHRTTG